MAKHVIFKKAKSKLLLRLAKDSSTSASTVNCLYPRVHIVLPCYNEEENLYQLTKDISCVLARQFAFNIVTVNDGSSDCSGDLLKKLSFEYPLKIVNHTHNMGLSATLRDGLMHAAASAEPEDFIITMDADNTHNASYIIPMIAAANDGADMIIASRYADGGLQLGVPRSRILLSKGVNYLINRLSGINVKDTTSGYRCYKASLLKRAQKEYGSHLIDSKGFEIQVELLVKLGALSDRIEEVPFTLRYDKKKGKSKMPLLKTIRNYIVLSTKIIVWRTRNLTNA